MCSRDRTVGARKECRVPTHGFAVHNVVRMMAGLLECTVSGRVQHKEWEEDKGK